MTTGKSFLEKNIVVAAIIYFLCSGFLLYKYGIQLGGEAEKYIDNANRIIQHEELRNGFFGIFYFSYSLLVSFFVRLSLDLVFVAILQLILSFIAAHCLYKLLLHALDNKRVAFLFFCAYLLCYPVQKWNFFLYSESMHTSFLVIGTWVFYKAMSVGKYSAWTAFGLVMLIILFSRPVGIIFLFAILITLMIYCYRNKKKALAFGLAFLSFTAIAAIANSPVAAFVNPDSLKRMEVICQVPEANADSSYQEFNRAGLYKAYLVIKNEIGFGDFFTTGLKKLACFFSMYRSYYSWPNNLLLLCYCIFYPFALIGIFSKQPLAFSYLRLLSIFYLALTSIVIFFTCDDWANRFISPAFPFVLILAAAGVNHLIKRRRITYT
jgi:hypothetical protein